MEDFYSIINNSKYYSDLANSTNVEILDYYGGSEDENIGYCKKFENETIYTILSSISDYGLKIFCRIRTLSDYITQYVRTKIFFNFISGIFIIYYIFLFEFFYYFKYNK